MSPPIHKERILGPDMVTMVGPMVDVEMLWIC